MATDYFQEMTRPAQNSGQRDWYAEFSGASDPRQDYGMFQKIAQTQDSPNPPGMVTSFVAGTMDDADERIKYLATQRFPKMPVEDAIKRYRMIGDDLVYVDEKGDFKREFGNRRSKVAKGVGEYLLPTIGGIAGGLTAGPGGAAALGGGGKAANKLIANAAGETQTSGGNAFDIGVEGLLNAAGWKLGDWFGKKIVDRRLTRDAVRFDKTKASQLIKMSKDKFGIDLTPAEASELGSLINEQTRLGMSMEEAGDIMRDFYTKRGKQVAGAVDDFIGAAPPASAAGAKGREAATAAITWARAERTAAARPMYESTVTVSNLVPDRGWQFKMSAFDDPVIAAETGKVIEHPQDLYKLNGAPRNSLAVIDQVKKNLDDQIEAAVRSGERNKARLLGQRKDMLLSAADDAFPDYAQARATFAGKSPEVTRLEEGLTGVLANMKDTSLVRAADNVFSASRVDPLDVADLRGQFHKGGYTKEWEDLTNAWLRKQWEGIRASGSGQGAGVKFRNQVFGSIKQQNIMEAALGPKRFAAMKDLMDVLEAVGRVPKGQSMTEPAMARASREAFEAAPIASTLNQLDVTRPASMFNLKDWWIDAKTRDWQTKLAQVITNPDAVKELEKLRRIGGLSSPSQKAINLVSLALTKAGAAGVSETLESRPALVPTLQRQ